MIVNTHVQTPATSYRPLAAARPDDQDEPPQDKADVSLGRTITHVGIGAGAGFGAGWIASKLVLASIAPFAALGVGIAVAHGGFSIGKHKVRDLLSPFKDPEDKNRGIKNAAVRIGAGLLAGGLTLALAGPATILAFTAAGGFAGHWLANRGGAPPRYPPRGS